MNPNAASRPFATSRLACGKTSTLHNSRRPQAFERDPDFVWGWYEWRRGLVLSAQPNAGHLAIAAMQRQVPHFMLITQNVDDLHERAGNKDVSPSSGQAVRRMRLTLGDESGLTPARGIPDTTTVTAETECGLPISRPMAYRGESDPYSSRLVS